MKKTTEPVKAADSLPTFLDEPVADTALDVDTTTATAEPTEPATADAEAAGPATEAAADRVAAATGEPVNPSRSVARHHHARHSGGGGGFGLLLGAAALLGGAALPFVQKATAALAPYGLTSPTLLLGGVVLVAGSRQQRRTGELQRRFDAAEARRTDELAALAHELRGLCGPRANDGSSENDQHLLIAVQRQDDKVNNLTKAIKMYGKPMMEIANQGAELAGSMANVKALVEGGAETSRQTLVRMETQLRSSQTNTKQELVELQQSLLKITSKLDGMATPDAASFAPMQQKLGQLEIAIAAVAQRLENTEVHKSLLRLEQVAAKEHDTLQQLVRGDAVREASAELKGQLERATRGLTDGLVQLRENNLGGLETAVRDIQREVSGVATAVAQINAAVKSGARAATAPAPATAAALPAAPTTAAATNTTAATPATPAAATAAPATPPAGAGGGYQTGTRATASKNVLGAIAKLKQMKN